MEKNRGGERFGHSDKGIGLINQLILVVLGIETLTVDGN